MGAGVFVGDRRLSSGRAGENGDNGDDDGEGGGADAHLLLTLLPIDPFLLLGGAGGGGEGLVLFFIACRQIYNGAVTPISYTDPSSNIRTYSSTRRAFLNGAGGDEVPTDGGW